MLDHFLLTLTFTNLNFQKKLTVNQQCGQADYGVNDKCVVILVSIWKE